MRIWMYTVCVFKSRAGDNGSGGYTSLSALETLLSHGLN